MKPILPLSVAQQVAGHIRSEIVERRLRGELAGIHQLASELMVNHKTVKVALEILQKEGLLVSQGLGKPRLIQFEGMRKQRNLRIAVLLYEPDDRRIDFILSMVQQLLEAGHQPFYAKKTLVDLKMDVNAVSRLVARTKADAWVVISGSLPVLEWFSKQSIDVFAFFGRVANLPIASAIPYTIPALREAIGHLIGMGHRRLVMIARKDRREPKPGFSEQTFLDEMNASGIPTGPFNLPEWEETQEGFRALLDSLFRHTPPTGMLIQSPELVTAVMFYCANHGIKVPQHLSVVSMDPNRTFAWCAPQVSHIGFETQPLVRRILAWTNNLARGHDDRRMITSEAEFIKGGTTAPPFKFP